MLKNIPNILSPDLLKILMEMGHGDEIVLADGNFPSASMAQRLIRLDGHKMVDVLNAILKLFPLDTFIEKPVSLMSVVKSDNYKPEIWEDFRTIISKSGEPFHDFEFIERFAFYEKAKSAYAIIATGETARYANIILKKGII